MQGRTRYWELYYRNVAQTTHIRLLHVKQLVYPKVYSTNETDMVLYYFTAMMLIGRRGKSTWIL